MEGFTWDFHHSRIDLVREGGGGVIASVIYDLKL